MQKTFDLLSASGFRESYLWVLEANPARAFYWHMGGTESAEKIIDIGGARLERDPHGLALK